MERRDYQPAQTLINQVPEPAQPQQDVKQAAESYRAPQLLVIGKATNLMKGYPYGVYVEVYWGLYGW